MKPSLLSLAILISMLFGLCVPHTAAQISLSDLTFEYQDECGNPLLESSLWREVEGKVISVIDGNSIILLDKDHKRRRVTLVAVDASIAGDSARSFLSQLVLNRTVSVLVSPSQAQSSTLVGVVHMSMKHINRELFAAGVVRYQEPIPHSVSDYTACSYRMVEKKARDDKKGIWKSAADLPDVLADANSATPQTKQRIITIYPSWTNDDDDMVCLELVEIKVAAQPIALVEPFDADDNWLKNMALRVKNVGTKPIAYFDVGAILFKGIEEKLAWDESPKYVIGWTWGKRFNPEKEKFEGASLEPGQSVGLTYANVSPFHRGVLAQVVNEGALRKLEFTGPAVKYIDGTEPECPNMRLPKQF